MTISLWLKINQIDSTLDSISYIIYMMFFVIHNLWITSWNSARIKENQHSSFSGCKSTSEMYLYIYICIYIHHTASQCIETVHGLYITICVSARGLHAKCPNNIFALLHKHLMCFAILWFNIIHFYEVK